ncbi:MULTISPECIES: hypothetical protein [Microbacterium]|uniref:hypothetical protein n=1 Tax=Microbacterium TaxID=33882 RepID=UPI001C2C5D88|nr:hypothetical protein [Microbacterium paraoxydans]QXE28929.1 hypothetical protein IZR02_11060 [Microbacterium paraoxydans]
MSDYTPTTEEVREFIEAADRVIAGMVAGSSAVEAFDRWQAAHDAEVRAGVVAEEPEGRRWFSAAYRAQNGNIIPIGEETVLAEYAQKTVDKFSREDDEGPDYFLASRILPPWVPVKQEGADDA